MWLFQIEASVIRLQSLTPTNGCLRGIGTTWEDVALSGFAVALPWWHTLEVVDYDLHPDYKRPSQRVIAYPKLVDKLDLILATGNIGMDSQDSRWSGYEAIITQPITWADHCRAIMFPEGDRRLF
jgi:hypothetical protein